MGRYALITREELLRLFAQHRTITPIPASAPDLAARLKITTATLYNYLRRYNIDMPNYITRKRPTEHHRYLPIHLKGHTPFSPDGPDGPDGPDRVFKVVTEFRGPVTLLHVALRLNMSTELVQYYLRRFIIHHWFAPQSPFRYLPRPNKISQIKVAWAMSEHETPEAAIGEAAEAYHASTLVPLLKIKDYINLTFQHVTHDSPDRILPPAHPANLPTPNVRKYKRSRAYRDTPPTSDVTP